MTKETLFNLKKNKLNHVIEKEAQLHWDNLSKPLDGLGDFEKTLTRIFTILGTERIDGFRKALVVMVSDNGIIEEGVSQCGQENTRIVARLLGAGRSSASVMAAFSGTDTSIIDIGIASEEKIAGLRNEKAANGSRNFLKAEALTEGQALRAIETGINTVRDLKASGYHILANGEMGIANTTTATALLCALLGMDPDTVTGRGAGLSDSGLRRKKEVIKKGLSLHHLDKTENTKEFAFHALLAVGGLDIAGLTGLYLGAAVYGMPVVIDGLISGVAALTADRLLNSCRDYMIASHSGREKGIELLLNALGLNSLINGNMALGEGTGALMLLPLLDMTLDYYNKAVRFEDADIVKYERQN